MKFKITILLNYKMSRICQKDNCQRVSIPRGKYCIIHRTGKKPAEIVSPLENRTIGEQKHEEERNNQMQQYEEERTLRKEKEYMETVERDTERMRMDDEKKENERFEEELAYVLKMTTEMDIENSIEKKRKRLEQFVVDENDKNNYKIKFKLKDFTVLKHFNKNSTINDLRNFVDIYIYENNIKIQNYDLVTNFPKEMLSDLEMKLSDTKLSKNCILYIENLD